MTQGDAIQPHTRRRRKSGSSASKPATAKTPKISLDNPVLPIIDAGVVAHQRQTLPTNANILGSFPYAFLPRRQYQSVDLSSINVSTLSPQQLIDLLSDSDPDVSLAWWNFLLLSCGNWHVDVRTPDDQEDPDGQDIMNDLLSVVNGKWGGFDNLLQQWTMSILLEGACCGETIPTDNFDGVHDIVPVTPWTIYFQRDARQDLIMYQWQPMIANGMVNSFYEPPTISSIANASYGAAGFRLLNMQTVSYVPFMPMVDDPYGRMPFASIFQVIVFDNQLLQDLRRWAHVNAWGRMDVSVLQESVQALMPPAVKANFPQAIAFLNGYLADIRNAYNNVGPDDTFIHYDNTKVGSVDSSGKTMQIDQLIKAIERKKFRALRMLPILMGSNEGTTETHGTVQWDIMARGIQSIQQCVSKLANTLLTIGLQLYGSTSHAQLAFELLRKTDEMADAQTEALAIKNAAEKRDQGWITQDEASIAITGSPAVAEAPNPDMMVAQNMPVAGAPLIAPPTAAPAKDADKAKTKSDKSEGTEADAGDTDSGDDGDDEDRAFIRSVFQDVLADIVTMRADSNANTGHTGVMLAFMLAPDDAKQLAIPDGEPAEDLHVTLAFLGDSSELGDEQLAALKSDVSEFTKSAPIVTGKISGIGRFTSVPEGEKTPVYASVDAPLLPEFRQGLVEAIADSCPANTEHGYTPHCTLAYIDADEPMPVESVPALDLTFDSLCLAIGDERTFYPLHLPESTPPEPTDRTWRDALAGMTYDRVLANVRAKAEEKETKKPTRQEIADNLAEKMAARFRATKIKDQTIRNIMTSLTNRNRLRHNARIKHELATAIRALIAKRDDPLKDLTPAQRAALKAEIADMLSDDIPDEDDDLTDDITDARTDAYNTGGQDGLDKININGFDFNLTNAARIAVIATLAVKACGFIQNTTRDQLATAILNAMEDGGDANTIKLTVDVRLIDMADARSFGIGQFETDQSYFFGVKDVWALNGIPEKVWVTSGDPDPHAGASGATPCRDNAYASPIPIDDTFPSGDDIPPAHSRCVCSVEPNGEPSESAFADPWLGD
jgi:2'-5' RNA ligase